MAQTQTRTRPTAASSAESNGKGNRHTGPRVIELDFDDALDADAIPESQTRSPLRTQLQKLIDGTLAGKVGRDENGELKFVAVNRYTTQSGAQTALKGLKDNPDRVPGDKAAWQFRKVVKVVDGKTISELRARYVVTEDE